MVVDIAIGKRTSTDENDVDDNKMVIKGGKTVKEKRWSLAIDVRDKNERLLYSEDTFCLIIL